MNETPQRPDSPRIPVRGIAMILLSVAVLLLAWGVYAMTNSGTETAAPAKKSQTSAQAPAGPQTPAPPAPATPQASPAQPTAAPRAPATPAPAPNAAAGAGAGTQNGDYTAVKIHALNNSTVQGLANRVADKLKRQGFSQVDSGNFPHEVLPHSVVFYTPGNGAEQQAAQAIAQNLGVKAEPRGETLKEAPTGVVLVITEDLNR
ncbi:LytR C-terminal domain-containing protein [Staphylococcus chromogenes]|nr:LytR C-terminal domain-containing protein [Staphylococcus chromogenes]